MLWPLSHIVARLRHPEPAPDRYADLSDIEMAQLKHLIAEPGFNVFLKVLDYTSKLNAEVLLSPQATSESRTYQSGLLSGLRKAGTLVDEILSTEQRKLEYARSAHSDGPDARNASFYASPAFTRKP